MSLATSDLGVLGNLAVALGVFTPAGDPNPDWFGDPGASLGKMLANQQQRDALIAFVDEALGGADRTTDPRGVVWLPIVELDDPALRIAITIDESPAEGIHLGLGLGVNTTDPTSETTVAIPLFRVWREGGPAVTNPLLLGSQGGRIRLSTSITIDSTPPVPGQARLGSIGIDIDLPTAPGDPQGPVFGLTLGGFQLPGAPAPRDLRVAADGLDQIDDALLDLVLSLVKSQADQIGADPLLASIAGLLGLRTADSIPDFPIVQLTSQGPSALAAWAYGILTTPAERAQWIGYLATLLGAGAVGDTITFTIGGTVNVTVRLGVDTGPSGHARLTPTLGLALGNDTARVEARASLFTVDLVNGSAVALPQFGVWGAAGTAAHRVLDIAGPPVARADTLRVGFALDAQRRLTFVLAADTVVLGAHTYPTLDLTSPDAVMDAVGNTVSDVANQLLAGAGSALTIVRLLLGLDPPGGVTAVSLSGLLTDPVAAVTTYWHDLLTAPPATVSGVLASLRDALADASAVGSAVLGSGTADDPWMVPLISPLALELSITGSVLSIGVAATTSIDTLGARCTVLDTVFAATIAEIDLANRTGSLLPAVEATVSARERGVNPPRAALSLGGGVTLATGGVGLRLRWTPAHGLAADVYAPHLALEVAGDSIPLALPVIAADGTVTLPAEAWDGVEALVGYFAGVLGGFFGDVVEALGWIPDTGALSTPGTTEARLRLADLVSTPDAALRAWLPSLMMSDTGRQALGLIADLFRGAGANHGVLIGTGHPDDPYRFDLADALPNVAIWFPPEGLERPLVGAPEGLQQWRPGQPGLAPDVLAAALNAEAVVADDVRDLVEARDVAGGLAALASRWAGTDGRIVPPTDDPDGIIVDNSGVAVGQLLGELDLEGVIGRVATTTVYAAVGTAAWSDKPTDHVIDLTAARLAASMFTIPAAAAGEWYVALPTRADALVDGSTTDGTPEQSARLARVLDGLAAVSADIALVAVAGAGHAARVAADAQNAVTDLVLLGTPLGPIALTAISTQPTADALRLLHRLLPTPLAAADPDVDPEDQDLTLGRALVASMMELTDLADPGADLRIAATTPPATRGGLTIDRGLRRRDGRAGEPRDDCDRRRGSRRASTRARCGGTAAADRRSRGTAHGPRADDERHARHCRRRAAHARRVRPRERARYRPTSSHSRCASQIALGGSAPHRISSCAW